jgi:hypothetical protein
MVADVTHPETLPALSRARTRSAQVLPGSRFRNVYESVTEFARIIRQEPLFERSSMS